MTPRETRAFLDRLDTIRSRVFMAATVAFCGYALIVEASRRPAEMARAFFWPSVILNIYGYPSSVPPSLRFADRRVLVTPQNSPRRRSARRTE